MKIEIKELQEFQLAFREDFGISLSKKEAPEALENLVRFFDLLAQFDEEDKQKALAKRRCINAE